MNNESAIARRMISYLVLLNIGTIIFFCFVSFGDHSDKNIIRAKGIIILDENGTERILIGSPVPYAKNRVRTDTAKAKNMYGNSWPQFRKYYNVYNPSTNGIILLDQNGYDKVIIGDPVPDPNTGKRIGTGTGIAINDEKGFERTGYGTLKVDGKYRVQIGFDSETGDAAFFTLLEDGSAGIIIVDSAGNIVYGNKKLIRKFNPGK